jgi:hypothetical protein
MPDAGKAYYIAFSNHHIVENGYAKTLLDSCLFYKIYNDNVEDIILICIHVDDIYLFASDINYIHEFNQKLEQKFKITVDMEADKKYLGTVYWLPHWMMVPLKCNNQSSLQHYSMNLQVNYQKQRRKRLQHQLVKV